jgi:hypothetical protein
MKRLLLIFCLTSTYQYLSSQTVISGRVTGAENKAIAFALVTLKQAADSSVVAYTTTDDDGKYQLSTSQKGEFIVQATYLGYASQTRRISLANEESWSNYDFVMTQDIIALHEVVVKGRKTGIVYANDTIRYDPKVFRDGTETVLGDVLKKLPGIEVDEKGAVKAHGKPVDKLMLNGQDFFEGNTQIATKNLSADIAESVEVLNNYSEYSFLTGFQSHEKTAINVGVNKEMFGKISGNISAAAGVENKYELKGDLLQIKPKWMTSMITSTNNNGTEIFSLEDYIRLQGGVNEFAANQQQSVITLSEEEQALLSPSNNVYQRNSRLIGLNIAGQTQNKLKINAYLLYHGKDEDTQEQSKDTYLLPGQQQYIISNTQNSNNNSKIFSGLAKFNYQPTPSLYIGYKSLFSNTVIKDNERATNQLMQQQINAEGYATTNSLTTKQNLTLMKGLGKHLFVSEASFAHDNKPFVYSMKSDSLLLPLPLITYDGFYRGRQNLNLTNTTGNINALFLLKINQSCFLRTGISTATTKQTYSSSIYQINMGQETLLTDENFANNHSIRMNDYNFTMALIKNKGFLRFRLGASSHIYGFEVEGIETNNDIKAVKLNPDIDISLNFSDRHALHLSGGASDNLLPAEAFVSGIVFNSYQRYTHNSGIWKLYNPGYHFSAMYKLFDLFSNTMIIANWIYNRTQNANTADYINRGLMSELMPVLSLPTANAYGRLYIRKGLGFIPWIAKFTGAYNDYAFYTQAAGEDNKGNVRNTSAKLHLETNYRHIFNAEARTEWEFIDNISSLGAVKTQTIQRCAGTLKCKFSDSFWANTELEYVENRSDINLYNWYLNTTISCKINKRTELMISGINMLNLNKQNWALTAYNGVYVSERHFSQIPGCILLKVNYKL